MADSVEKPGDTKEELLQKLNEKKKEAAKKLRKLEKLRRAERVKAHRQQKIKEHQEQLLQELSSQSEARTCSNVLTPSGENVPKIQSSASGKEGNDLALRKNPSRNKIQEHNKQDLKSNEIQDDLQKNGHLRNLDIDHCDLDSQHRSFAGNVSSVLMKKDSVITNDGLSMNSALSTTKSIVKPSSSNENKSSLRFKEYSTPFKTETALAVKTKYLQNPKFNSNEEHSCDTTKNSESVKSIFNISTAPFNFSYGTKVTYPRRRQCHNAGLKNCAEQSEYKSPESHSGNDKRLHQTLEVGEVVAKNQKLCSISSNSVKGSGQGKYRFSKKRKLNTSTHTTSLPSNPTPDLEKSSGKSIEILSSGDGGWLCVDKSRKVDAFHKFKESFKTHRSKTPNEETSLASKASGSHQKQRSKSDIETCVTESSQPLIAVSEVTISPSTVNENDQMQNLITKSEAKKDTNCSTPMDGKKKKVKKPEKERQGQDVLATDGNKFHSENFIEVKAKTGSKLNKCSYVNNEICAERKYKDLRVFKKDLTHEPDVISSPILRTHSMKKKKECHDIDNHYSQSKNINNQTGVCTFVTEKENCDTIDSRKSSVKRDTCDSEDIIAVIPAESAGRLLDLYPSQAKCLSPTSLSTPCFSTGVNQDNTLKAPSCLKNSVTDSEFFNILGVSQKPINTRNCLKTQQYLHTGAQNSQLGKEAKQSKTAEVNTPKGLVQSSVEASKNKIQGNSYYKCPSHESEPSNQSAQTENVVAGEEHPLPSTYGLTNLNAKPKHQDTEIPVSELTELDVIPFSQFELSEDFLSENSQNTGPQPRVNTRRMSLVKRKSPRLSSLQMFVSESSSSSSQASSVDVLLGAMKGSRKSMSQQRKAAAVMSVFQLLSDKAKSGSSFTEFELPKEFDPLKTNKHDQCSSLGASDRVAGNVIGESEVDTQDTGTPISKSSQGNYNHYSDSSLSGNDKEVKLDSPFVVTIEDEKKVQNEHKSCDHKVSDLELHHQENTLPLSLPLSHNPEEEEEPFLLHKETQDTQISDNFDTTKDEKPSPTTFVNHTDMHDSSGREPKEKLGTDKPGIEDSCHLVQGKETNMPCQSDDSGDTTEAISSTPEDARTNYCVLSTPKSSTGKSKRLLGLRRKLFNRSLNKSLHILDKRKEKSFVENVIDESQSLIENKHTNKECNESDNNLTNEKKTGVSKGVMMDPSSPLLSPESRVLLRDPFFSPSIPVINTPTSRLRPSQNSCLKSFSFTSTPKAGRTPHSEGELIAELQFESPLKPLQDNTSKQVCKSESIIASPGHNGQHTAGESILFESSLKDTSEHLANQKDSVDNVIRHTERCTLSDTDDPSVVTSSPVKTAGPDASLTIREHPSNLGDSYFVPGQIPLQPQHNASVVNGEDDDSYLSPGQIPPETTLQTTSTFDHRADQSMGAGLCDLSTTLCQHIQPWMRIPRTPGTPMQVLEEKRGQSHLTSPSFTPHRRRARTSKAAAAAHRKAGLDSAGGLKFAGCFQPCSQDSVVSLLSGKVCLPGHKPQPFMVSVQATALTVWAQDDSEGWTTELDWRLAQDTHILQACLVPTTEAVMVVASGSQACKPFTNVFVYCWDTEDTVRINIPLAEDHQALSHPTKIALCPVSGEEIQLGISSHSSYAIRKVELSQAGKVVTHAQLFHPYRGQLLSLVAVQGQNSASLVLTGDQRVVLWNTERGLPLKSYTLPTSLPCFTGLVHAETAMGHLFLDATLTGSDQGDTGARLALNPLTRALQQLCTYSPPNNAWKRFETMCRDGHHILAVSDRGALALWDGQSGQLVGHTSTLTTTAAALVGGGLVMGEIHGCLHWYTQTTS